MSNLFSNLHFLTRLLTQSCKDKKMNQNIINDANRIISRIIITCKKAGKAAMAKNINEIVPFVLYGRYLSHVDMAGSSCFH